ncbi:hypothetical protein ABW19_dt0207984 [Dactylella cylindrospora]|nr:hypothetical protein ABW19_dt0207984 [Dactylella cylindrospora]
MPREDATVDHYAALEVQVTATSDEIKKQFRKLALKYHPDRNPGREVEFNAKFQQIQAAHELLTDPTRRKVYDRSRLYRNGITRSKSQQYPATSTTQTESPTTRKYTTANPTRSGFASGSRPGDGPFSSKHQWEHTPRAYTQPGASAWKATHERWQQRPAREVPRTPKKTRDNPYVSPDSESFVQSEPRGHKEDVFGEKTPLKHGFFADRNPREKEWMDTASEARSSGESNPRSSGVWEGKSSSEEDAPKSSTFYAYTPRTRLRTNPRDKSPEKSNMNNTRTNNVSPSETPVSPLRSNVFTRSQTMRDSKQFSESANSAQAQDRRRSNSSTGVDGPERRRFSYLFSEDGGTRRSHRAPKQPAVESDHDGDDDAASRSRSRQSYPSSRRNTLERDGLASKTSSESRNSNSFAASERSRFSHQFPAMSEGKF